MKYQTRRKSRSAWPGKPFVRFAGIGKVSIAALNIEYDFRKIFIVCVIVSELLSCAFNIKNDISLRI